MQVIGTDAAGVSSAKSVNKSVNILPIVKNIKEYVPVVSNPINKADTGSSLINAMLDIQNKANELSLASARETNAFNAQEAEKNRQFQLELSNTAHQREVEDLVKAGLNPILSAMGGNGASTPSGSTASGSNPYVDSGISAIASIIGASINASASMNIARMNNANDYAIAQLNSLGQDPFKKYGNIFLQKYFENFREDRGILYPVMKMLNKNYDSSNFAKLLYN